MKITVVVPILNQPEVTQEFLDNLRVHEGSQHLPLIIVDNGSNPPVRDWLLGLREGDLVIRNEDNAGVMPALNQAYEVAKRTSDFIFYTHNDVMIYEQGWDDKLVRILSENPNIGVAGFYGAKGIGVPGIYQMPYEQSQLIRLENVSNCTRMDPGHGYRPLRGGEVEEVAVMDGFSLIVNVELLDKIGGFDRRYPIHHMYDNDICLESLDKGYRNIVIAMDALHYGGRTDVGEDWTKGKGVTKQEVHTAAHPVFYEKWHPAHKEAGNHKIALPVRVP